MPTAHIHLPTPLAPLLPSLPPLPPDPTHPRQSISSHLYRATPPDPASYIQHLRLSHHPGVVYVLSASLSTSAPPPATGAIKLREADAREFEALTRAKLGAFWSATPAGRGDGVVAEVYCWRGAVRRRAGRVKDEDGERGEQGEVEVELAAAEVGMRGGREMGSVVMVTVGEGEDARGVLEGMVEDAAGVGVATHEVEAWGTVLRGVLATGTGGGR